MTYLQPNLSFITHTTHTHTHTHNSEFIQKNVSPVTFYYWAVSLLAAVEPTPTASLTAASKLRFLPLKLDLRPLFSRSSPTCSVANRQRQPFSSMNNPVVKILGRSREFHFGVEGSNQYAGGQTSGRRPRATSGGGIFFSRNVCFEMVHFGAN